MAGCEWSAFCGESAVVLATRVRRPELESLGPRLMVLAGDAGPSGQGSAGLLAELTQAQSLVLRDYECLPWSDLVADRGTEIVAGWLRFLDGVPLPGLALPDGEGEAAGISYRIRGSGPPLVLMPLDLAPAQWEPLIAGLVPRYSTITLGGPLVGVVALLESRGRSISLSHSPSNGSGPWRVRLLIGCGAECRNVSTRRAVRSLNPALAAAMCWRWCGRNFMNNLFCWLVTCRPGTSALVAVVEKPIWSGARAAARRRRPMPTSLVGLAEGGASPTVGFSPNWPSVRAAGSAIRAVAEDRLRLPPAPALRHRHKQWSAREGYPIDPALLSRCSGN